MNTPKPTPFTPVAAPACQTCDEADKSLSEAEDHRGAVPHQLVEDWWRALENHAEGRHRPGRRR